MFPRLPLDGNLDLTYRCNNKCRHCWLREPNESAPELSFTEITKIIVAARKMGCRSWSLSGGEPLLRSDFPEVFDFITRHSATYSLNTNGSLITPGIARLLRRKGAKCISLYGATSRIHDHITRTPGSFERTMRGFRYLKEAGVDFIVQLMVMKDNYHQLNRMVLLAKSLSKRYKFGSAWLYLSACGDKHANAEIRRQRLSPREVVKIDKSYISNSSSLEPVVHCRPKAVQYLFSACIREKRDFHIDPYGRMSFCYFIKDPSLRYDLRKGSFGECWERFIPSLARKVKTTTEYRKDCGSCEAVNECRWCPVYGYLEHRRFSAEVKYLCNIAKEQRKCRREWLATHRRYFAIGGISLQVDSDIPMDGKTFHPKFKEFETRTGGKDVVTITHHFSIPKFDDNALGEPVYRKLPWAIYKKGCFWVYLGISSEQSNEFLHTAAVFNADHTRAQIYHRTRDVLSFKESPNLTLLSTDQILLARILADRQGCIVHACGVNLEGRGFLFVGHSGAGKSTIARLLKDKAEVLCDDRMIIRSSQKGVKIYGTWSHGDVPDVSGNSAPLSAILFIEQSDSETSLIRIVDSKDIIHRILPHLIQPLVTVDWWDKMITLIKMISIKVPCYILRFEKDGAVGDVLLKL